MALSVVFTLSAVSLSQLVMPVVNTQQLAQLASPIQHNVAVDINQSWPYESGSITGSTGCLQHL